MKAKRKILAAAMTAALALGVSGEAAASIYARSYYLFDNLSVAFGTLDAQGNFTPGGATITSWQQSQTNTAGPLIPPGGAPISFSAQCISGVLACGPAGSRLDAQVANATGSNPVRAENSFAFVGPSAGGEYGHADSILRRSELAGDATTNLEQIVETEIQNSIFSRANVITGSSTGLSFTFVVTTPGTIIISFDASSSIFAQINDPTAAAANAQASRNAELLLTKDNSTENLLWRPDGVTGASGNILNHNFGTVVSETDPADLQDDVTTSTLPCSNDPAQACPGVGVTTGPSFYRLIFSGLTAGTWTLALTAENFAQVSRTPGVPEPATLALLGIGLAGLGFASRRRKNA